MDTTPGVKPLAELQPPAAGKTVQLYVEGNPILLVSGNTDYHGDMLRKFLEGAGIQYARRKNGFPELEGQRYRAVGMSHCLILDGTMYISGRSAGYRIGPDPKHLEDLLPHADGMDFKVT